MRIAVVTPWFSDSIAGGAERFAGGIAKSLQSAGADVEILTTCGKDSFWDWGKDYYDEGKYSVDGLTVRRFSLRPRNKQLYERLLVKLMQEKQLIYSEEMQYLLETVNSDSLNEYIYNSSEDCKFLFIPYLYGTTYWGSKVRPNRSYIIPCLHDEEMAYFQTVKHMLQGAAGVLFNTIEEQEFSRQLHELPEDRCVVSGGGVELTCKPDSTAFREKFHIDGEYIVYVGRLVTGKNVPQLIEFFNRLKGEGQERIKLVFVGKGESQLEEWMKNSPDILHVGELDDQDKYNAMAGARALIQPSLMESFSIVIMESWLCGTPVIVHEQCSVTKGHVDRSQGGFYYKDYEGFKKVIGQVASSTLDLTVLGARGRRYVEEVYTWSKTAERIITFLESKRK